MNIDIFNPYHQFHHVLRKEVKRWSGIDPGGKGADKLKKKMVGFILTDDRKDTKQDLDRAEEEWIKIAEMVLLRPVG